MPNRNYFTLEESKSIKVFIIYQTISMYLFNTAQNFLRPMKCSDKSIAVSQLCKMCKKQSKGFSGTGLLDRHIMNICMYICCMYIMYILHT